MSKRENSAVIQDIKESLNRIISYTSKMEYKDFVQDCKTQDAVIRNIEILGEATKLLSDILTGKPGIWSATPYAEKISPDKYVDFLCTTGSFTLPPESQGFVMLC